MESQLGLRCRLQAVELYQFSLGGMVPVLRTLPVQNHDALQDKRCAASCSFMAADRVVPEGC
jgi:hypothetical protein